MHSRRLISISKGVWLAALLAPLVLTACSETKTTKVTQVWDDRPRVFTAEPGEEHSKFMNVVWYERPRFFTKAPGEDQSRFSRMWDDRPRVFTTRTSYESSTYEPSYRTYDYDREYRTVPAAETVSPGTTYTAPPPTSYVPPAKTYTAPLPPADTPPPATNGTARGVTRRQDTYHPGTEMRRDRVELVSDVVARSMESVVANWPQESREAAMKIQDEHGTPDHVAPDQLIWRDADSFAEITVFKTGTPHNFPTSHMDVVAHSVYLDLDAVDAGEFNNFRGNIKVDHARGLLTSKCKSEVYNILALNLAHDIISGSMTVDQANDVLADKAKLIDQAKLDDDLLKSLKFEAGERTDTDENGVDYDPKDMPDRD